MLKKKKQQPKTTYYLGPLLPVEHRPLTTLLHLNTRSCWFCQCFGNVFFFIGRGVGPTQSPFNLWGEVVQFVSPLPFDLSSFDDSTRRLYTCWNSSPGHWGTQATAPWQGMDCAVDTEKDVQKFSNKQWHPSRRGVKSPGLQLVF